MSAKSHSKLYHNQKRAQLTDSSHSNKLYLLIHEKHPTEINEIYFCYEKQRHQRRKESLVHKTYEN